MLACLSSPEGPRLSVTSYVWLDHLEDVQTAQSELLEAMAEMAGVTQTPGPIRDRYTAARERLTKASEARTALWSKLYPKLHNRISCQEAAELEALDAANRHFQTRSAAHLSRWTYKTIERDW